MLLKKVVGGLAGQQAGSIARETMVPGEAKAIEIEGETVEPASEVLVSCVGYLG